MLWRVYGETSYSKYNDTSDIGSSPETALAIGHVNYEGEWLEHKKRLLSSRRIHFVKTHEPPEDDSPAIYVVRDGMAAIVSNYHYWKDIEDINYSTEDLISGKSGPFLSWGSHLDAWDPKNRKNTLILRYEDLVSNPAEQLKKISDFISIPQKAQWSNDFSALNKINPKFFRRGRTAIDQKDLSPAQIRLIRHFHEDWLLAFNYIPATFDIDIPSECRYLRSLVLSIRSETRRAASDAQKHIDGLLTQLQQLAATSQQQAEYISILEKERDRLQAESHQARNDNQHYLNVINEQTNHIEILKKIRASDGTA